MYLGDFIYRTWSCFYIIWFSPQWCDWQGALITGHTSLENPTVSLLFSKGEAITTLLTQLETQKLCLQKTTQEIRKVIYLHFGFSDQNVEGTFLVIWTDENSIHCLWPLVAVLCRELPAQLKKECSKWNTEGCGWPFFSFFLLFSCCDCCCYYFK